MKTNKERAISPEKQLRRILKKVKVHSKKTASPVFAGRDRVRAIRPLF